MTTTVEVTDRARLAAASSLEGFYCDQVLALTQLCLNRQAEIAALKSDHVKALEEQEAGFLARIAGLEDELRMARGTAQIVEAATDGE